MRPSYKNLINPHWSVESATSNANEVFYFTIMPNHITNRIILQGEESEVKSIIEKFSTTYPEKENKSYDGHIVYKTVDGNIGWLDKESSVFTRRDMDAVLGVPVGFTVDMEKEWTRFPDFEKVHPVPQVIKEVGDSVSHNIIDAVYKRFNKGLSDNHFIAFLELENRRNSTLKPEDQFQFEKACKAYKETGFCYWYDFNQAKWGTKWNAYDCVKISDNVFHFDTAWCGVPDMIEEISKSFNGTIVYDFADEDTGYNVGSFVFCAGFLISENVPKGGSVEAYGLAFDINPECKSRYRLIEGKYEYFEEESEGE